MLLQESAVLHQRSAFALPVVPGVHQNAYTGSRALGDIFPSDRELEHAMKALNLPVYGRDDVGLVGESFAAEPTDLGVVPTLGQTVADLELVFAPTEMARRGRRKII